MQKDQLLSISEAAEIIGVSIDTLRRWDKKGILKSFRPHKTSKRHYLRKELEDFLDRDYQSRKKRKINPLKKQALFWDADLDKLNLQKHQKYIIERILSRGDVEDFNWLIKKYSKKIIKETLVNSRRIDKKSFNYWCIYFNIDREKCIKNRYQKTPSAFSKR